MIGKRAIFIRSIWKTNGHGIERNVEYSGLVLDKIRSVDRVEGKFTSMDFYLVELEKGIIAKFYCDEAVKIIETK